jgi:hypothetical protein
MPIFSQRIFSELDTERIICIGGVLSGGKTRLAFDLALPYWRSRKYQINSNVVSNFEGIPQTKTYRGVHIGDKENFHLFKTFNILDEGGEYVRTLKLASSITRSAGKADYYMIFSGKKMPHKELQGVVVRPRFNFWDNFGLPLILWSAKVNSDVPYKFNFIQWFPQALHGTYSTLSSSAGIENIIKRADNTVQLLAYMEGQVAGQTTEAGIEGLADDIANSTEGLLS